VTAAGLGRGPGRGRLARVRRAAGVRRWLPPRPLKPFDVDAGPIAAWFTQPGGGWQDQLVASLVPRPPTVNVLWLVDHGYLQRLA
jgi:hypothetical protein